MDEDLCDMGYLLDGANGSWTWAADDDTVPET